MFYLESVMLFSIRVKKGGVEGGNGGGGQAKVEQKRPFGVGATP